MNFRELYERREREFLSPRATLAKNSVGRSVREQDCEFRTCFARDRDRIIHSKAFRRLKQKTQVFLSPSGDHYRTRLTHTLEVSQISRTIARCLRLGEDLTEAIALAHDLGHTPFGHAGERALNKICPFEFVHNEQSVRVVELIENCGQGLNLTGEVIDGIRCHTGERKPSTLEGQIVRLADRIAYVNHDIDDALRASLISYDQLPGAALKVLGKSSSERINTMIKGIVYASLDSSEICMQPSVYEAMDALRNFLFESVYTCEYAKREEEKAHRMIEQLFEYFTQNSGQIPEEFQGILEKSGKPRAVCDYISGMTDGYIVNIYKQIFMPRSWDFL